MTKYSLYLFIYALSHLTFVARAQTVQNVRAAFDGERVQITYDLNHDDPSEKFKVSLYSSHDNFDHPLTLLTGDIGDQVSPGKDRKVLWFAKNVLPQDFDLEITIKVRVTLAASPEVARLSLKPLQKTVFKRGASLKIEWAGGAPTDQVTIELLKDGKVQQRIAEKIVNVHQYRWSIPRKLKTGEGYSLQVLNPNKNAEITTTQSFVIRPRVSMILKLLPIAIGAGVYLLLPNPPPPMDDLPGPVEPD